MNVWLELDCGIADPGTIHLPRDEQTLKKGYGGRVSIAFEPDDDADPIPNPFKKGQHTKLWLRQSRIEDTLRTSCGCEKLNDMDDARISVMIRSAGNRVVRRIPASAFRNELRDL